GVTAIAEVRATEKGIALNVERDPQLTVNLVGDSLRLSQILLNIVGNAVKFTEHGGVTLRITLVRSGPSHDVLRFIIRDTGIGMDEEQRNRLFQSFSQADSSITR